MTSATGTIGLPSATQRDDGQMHATVTMINAELNGGTWPASDETIANSAPQPEDLLLQLVVGRVRVDDGRQR
jgi:hypothetical protein